MKGMTTQEKYNEICALSGMSEDVVRRVINAEKQSTLNALKRGERATLIGRCVIRPEIRSKLSVGGKITNYIKLNAEVASSLESELKDLTGFQTCENSENTDNKQGIRLNQIAALV